MRRVILLLVMLGVGCQDASLGVPTVGDLRHPRDLGGLDLSRMTLHFESQLLELPIGVSSFNLVTGDLNEDGAPDVVAPALYRAVPGIAVFLNNGHGSLQSPARYPAGATPARAAIGDFNGDKRPDLAILDLLSHVMTPLFGKGDGSFVTGKVVNLSHATWFEGANDLDGDGNSDLYLVNDSVDGISTALGLLSFGDGTFRESAALAVKARQSAAVSADFNGDGRIDLAVSSTATGTLTILLGNGDGTFRTGHAYAIGLANICIGVGDFDRDGAPDLLLGSTGDNSVSVLISIGGGAFGTPTRFDAHTAVAYLAITDLNGDGLLDVAATGGEASIAILAGNGDGTFGFDRKLPLADTAEALQAADFDRDGKQDLIAGTFAGTLPSIVLLLNRSQ